MKSGFSSPLDRGIRRATAFAGHSVVTPAGPIDRIALCALIPHVGLGDDRQQVQRGHLNDARDGRS